MNTDDLCHAIWEQDFEKVRTIISGGLDLDGVSATGITPLMQAIEMNDLYTVKMLLETGANINAQGYLGHTALIAAVTGSIEHVLYGSGNQGDEPTEMIIFLLENGADKSIADSEVGTPLDWAKGYGSKKIIKLLST